MSKSERERAISKAVRETLDEMLAEDWARRSSPVWATRTERAITDRLLALPDPVQEVRELRSALVAIINTRDGDADNVWQAIARAALTKGKS